MLAQKNLFPRHARPRKRPYLFMPCRLHRERAEAEPNTADAPNRIPPMQRDAPGDARSADPEPQLSSRDGWSPGQNVRGVRGKHAPRQCSAVGRLIRLSKDG